MNKKEILSSIEKLQAWYWKQLNSKTVRLFQGRDNEITDEGIYNSHNDLDMILRSYSRRGELKPEHESKLKRMVYFNLECWPLTRIEEVFGEKPKEKKAA